MNMIKNPPSIPNIVFDIPLKAKPYTKNKTSPNKLVSNKTSLCSISITSITPRKIKIGRVAQKLKIENGKKWSKTQLIIELISTMMFRIDLLLPQLEHFKKNI